MKNIGKFVTFSAAIIGAQIVSVAAMAAPSFPMQGLVDVEKGIQLKCVLKLSLDSGGLMNVQLDPGNSNCSLLSINSNNHVWSYNPVNGDLTIEDMDVTTITIGDCAGDITANWDDVTGELVIDSFLPAKTGGPDCLVWGVIPNTDT